MSEYNIQMNKYNASKAGYDQLYPQPMKHASTHAKDGNDPITPSMIGTYTKTEIDTALQKKAPAGYGLGSIEPRKVSSWDEAIENGWYGAPAPTHDIGSGDIWGFVSSLTSNYLTQTVYMDNSPNCVAMRECIGGTWKPWEWVNPPMRLNTEYRTTERYQDKPVYVRVYDCGYFPNKGTEKQVSLNITNLNDIVRFSGTMETAGLPTMENASSNILERCVDVIGKASSNPSIRMHCLASDAGTYYKAIVSVYYTKTTD